MNQFIQKIQSCPMLWDVNDLLYRDVAQKNARWDYVALECGMTNGQEAKNIWKKLRCSYREAMRRRSIDKSLPAWKYEGLMSFLAQSPHQADATYESSNFPENAEEKGESDDEDIAIVKLENDIEALNDATSPERDIDVSFYKVDSSNDSRLKEPMREVGRDRSVRNTLSPPTRLREKLRDDREQQRREFRRSTHDWSRLEYEAETRGCDALTNLFTSLCQKTRQLPKYLQLTVQREIFEAVIRAEEEALANERSLHAASKLD